MNLLNATRCLTVFILGAAWTLIAPEFATAQTNQGFVIRDPASAGFQDRQRPKSTNRASRSERVPATRKFLPARWTQDQDQDESPQERLEKDVDSVDLQDRFQDQLQGEIQEGVELDEDSQQRERRRTDFDFGEWPRRKIYEIRTTVKDDADVIPDDVSYLLTEKTEPDWFMAPHGEKVFAWVAPNIRYQPLYFQNVALERYGQNYGGLKQIGASGVHFFVSFCRLPYAVIADHPRSCEYPLGYCRPGNPTPLTFQKLLYPCRD